MDILDSVVQESYLCMVRALQTCPTCLSHDVADPLEPNAFPSVSSYVPFSSGQLVHMRGAISMARVCVGKRRKYLISFMLYNYNTVHLVLVPKQDQH